MHLGRDLLRIVALTATALILAVGSAHAQSSDPVSLRWTPALEEGCPSESDMREEIRRILGPEGPRKEVAVRGVVAQRGGGLFRVALELQSGSSRSTRSFSGTTCREVSAAAALIIALTVDGNAKPPNTPAFSAPAPLASPPPGPAASATTAATATTTAHADLPQTAPAAGRRQKRPAPTFGAAATTLFRIGSVPSPAGGAAFGLWAELAALRVEIELAKFFSRGVGVDGAPWKGGEFRMSTAGGRACALFGYRELRMGPCFAAELVNAYGVGFGTARPRNEGATWAGLGGELIALVPLSGRLRLRIGARATGALETPRFVVATPEGSLPITRPSPFAFVAALGLELKIL